MEADDAKRLPLSDWSKKGGWMANLKYDARRVPLVKYLQSVPFLDEKLKVPLTPKCFLNRNKTLFGVDYFGEKICL